MDNLPEMASSKTLKVVIVLLEEDMLNIHSHHDDPMVIIVKCKDWEIKRFLVDQGSSANLLYYDAFGIFHLDPEDLKPVS